jgi:hypothetical protein
MVFETQSVHLPHVDYSHTVELNWSGNNNNVMVHAYLFHSARNATTNFELVARCRTGLLEVNVVPLSELEVVQGIRIDDAEFNRT